MKKWLIVIIVIIAVVLVGLFSFKQLNFSEDNDNSNLEMENAEVLESPDAEEENTELQDEEVIEEVQVEKPLTFEETVWTYRIENAMVYSKCLPVQKIEYPKNYYKGPLIDSHFHIPHLPDSPPGEEEGEEVFYSKYYGDNMNDEDKNEDENDEEEDSFDPQTPLLGKNINMNQIVCTLKHEGTDRVFAFFPVYPEIDLQSIEIVKRTMDQYPEYFVPFIMAPDNDNEMGGFPTVDAATLRGMLAVYPNLFRGYGEIGLYAREDGADKLLPDAKRLQEIYPIVRENNLVVYFHPGENMEDNFEKVLEKNPDINFIVHGEQIEKPDEIGDLMSKYPNIYFTVNDLYGDQYLLHPGENAESFIDALENYEPLLKKDLATWKKLIEKYPNQFLWGTDRGGIAVWTFDVRVGQKLVDYGRAFIGKLDPAVQEKFAYKNAERLFD